MESSYSCLIVDDEYPAHDVITALLKSCTHLKCVKSCYNGEDALVEINTNAYDIVFLDVSMPILNGIDLLRNIEVKPAIIMITAYTNFAFEAYENDAVDYLQKPISEQRFNKAITKAVDYAKKRRTEAAKTIVLKIDGIKHEINQESIMYCQSMGNYTRFFVANSSKPILVNKSLTNQLTALNQDLFVQIHRTCIVNKLFIVSKRENTLVLENDIQLPIGRKFITQVYAVFQSK
jgi:two-component system, LytTR family, response regulator